MIEPTIKIGFKSQTQLQLTAKDFGKSELTVFGHFQEMKEGKYSAVLGVPYITDTAYICINNIEYMVYED